MYFDEEGHDVTMDVLSQAVDEAPDPLEARIATLERQVDLLRRALTLLNVSVEPTIKWMDAKWDGEANRG